MFLRAAKGTGLDLDMLQDRVDSFVGFRIHLMFDESDFGAKASTTCFGSLSVYEGAVTLVGVIFNRVLIGLFFEEVREFPCPKSSPD